VVHSKNKGRVGELEVVKLYQKYGFKNARRAQQFKGTKDSADIECVPHHVEVKRREVGGGTLEKWLTQAESEVAKGIVPVVFHRASRESWKVTLRADEFLAMQVLIYNEAQKSRKE
jgi:hypothetical protein